MTEETRPLESDERALFEWFFDQWTELAVVRSALLLDAPAEIFARSDDGYRTLSVAYGQDSRPNDLPTPFPREGRGEIDGHPLEVLFFVGDDRAMVEVIWSAGTWPGRLPHPDELQSYERL